MKINADPKIAQLPPLAGPAERKPAATGPATAEAEPSAKVLLSSAAQRASAALGAEAGIDAEKVARMSAAIADGSFKVDPEAIADKLIANAREQLAKAYGKTGSA